MSQKVKHDFVICSGMMRSGTTLLQKIINTHPQINIQYQSCTSLFLESKKNFLEEINRTSYHKLSHYNEKGHYTLPEFTKWLLINGEPLLNTLRNNLTVSDHRYVGVKEILIEEFFPWLVNAEVKCILIVRDPRAVLASTAYGSTEHTGKPRPTLFDIRNWRKSVQIGRLLQSNKHFKLVRFEELLKEPEPILRNIFQWLGMDDVDCRKLVGKFESENNKSWMGNSSFSERRGLDIKAIDDFSCRLSSSVLSYIEATCQEEMSWLNYSHSNLDKAERVRLVKNFREPLTITRPEFSPDYSIKKSNVEFEIARIEDYSSNLFI
ncbi:sulfotransferase [Lacimicrobium sp. SS2-24]|uniref:sulfotransferase family protein n=1 Tax=Lacimicrobium sp. SS2-24 TaxID=2005569 RepID=UPI000B4BAB5E|nr:sulfotransferase [Lacimicrobium sp. SS2-24]